MKRVIYTAAIFVVAMVASIAVQTSAAQARCGAIAYSASARYWAAATGYATCYQARRAALRRCRRRGYGCRVATWFENSCGALATARDGAWGGDWGRYPAQARRKAIRRCRRETAYRCRVIVSRCA
ncbi:MAG: DUF4189 domain-containing protein [Neomegalonema sp.]|nr:DUF4189 domain-containing protein [Neomegalonema sp.]